ncbi:MAG: hypothetical protein HYU97_00125 [Deltaproteobacteria bacterium]|nr:hypothetical protein [Deltaproteobacteria bacterium]
MASGPGGVRGKGRGGEQGRVGGEGTPKDPKVGEERESRSRSGEAGRIAAVKAGAAAVVADAVKTVGAIDWLRLLAGHGKPQSVDISNRSDVGMVYEAGQALGGLFGRIGVSPLIDRLGLSRLAFLRPRSAWNMDSFADWNMDSFAELSGLDLIIKIEPDFGTFNALEFSQSGDSIRQIYAPFAKLPDGLYEADNYYVRIITRPSLRGVVPREISIWDNTTHSLIAPQKITPTFLNNLAGDIGAHRYRVYTPLEALHGSLYELLMEVPARELPPVVQGIWMFMGLPVVTPPGVVLLEYSLQQMSGGKMDALVTMAELRGNGFGVAAIELSSGTVPSETTGVPVVEMVRSSKVSANKSTDFVLAQLGGAGFKVRLNYEFFLELDGFAYNVLIVLPDGHEATLTRFTTGRSPTSAPFPFTGPLQLNAPLIVGDTLQVSDGSKTYELFVGKGGHYTVKLLP